MDSKTIQIKLVSDYQLYTLKSLYICVHIYKVKLYFTYLLIDITHVVRSICIIIYLIF